jgi:CelD/BcsL family acetyltransferase involved in cellulose biosynthesis
VKVRHQPCAFLIGWQLNGRFYAHETAYDPAWGSYSPGKTLFHLVIKDCFKTKPPRIFHFGPGEAPYKRWFANRVGDEATLILLKRNPLNRSRITLQRLFRRSVEALKSAREVWPHTSRLFARKTPNGLRPRAPCWKEVRAEHN